MLQVTFGVRLGESSAVSGDKIQSILGIKKTGSNLEQVFSEDNIYKPVLTMIPTYINTFLMNLNHFLQTQHPDLCKC